MPVRCTARSRSLRSELAGVFLRSPAGGGRATLFQCLVVWSASLALLLPLRSVQWDLNGLAEADAITTGGPALFSANHLLYRPLGLAIFATASRLGYEGSIQVLLQLVTAFLASLGVSLFFLAARSLTGRTTPAALAALLLAGSWSWWTFSTDIHYITPAGAAASAALALTASSLASPLLLGAAVGAAASVAILFWQANVFLLPALLVGVAWTRTDWPMRRRLTTLATLLLTAFTFTTTCYAIASVIGHRHRGLPVFLAWVSSHASKGQIDLWGHWSLDRLPTSLVSAASSFIPVWNGLGLRALLRGETSWDNLLPQLSLMAFAVLAVWSCLMVLVEWRTYDATLKRTVTWLGGGAIAFMPFIVWWDPYEPKWFVVPNVFLVAALSVIWSRAASRTLSTVVLPCIAIICMANFSATIWPRHSQPNPAIAVAQCVARAMTADDILAVTDWEFAGYLPTLTSYEGEYLQLVGASGHAAEDLRIAATEVKATGGHLYVRAMSGDDTAAWSYLESLTGLTRQEYESLKVRPAFACGPATFVEVVGQWP